ncbi:MAG: RagB/SusD family nutrient uptake outer membrane protein [Sphingobacteriales bacterium]|nr:MAG: RagB/SusD family nutrient uptake outer membrane protein [Sphingobacteriales bacterium]
MKKLIYIMAGFALLLGACSKDLRQKPISSSTTETFFQSETDFLMAVDGAFAAGLRGNTLGNSYGYPDRLMNLSETRSDNLYAITDGARPWEGINGLQTSIANNQYVTEAWANNYDAIAKANVVLQQIALKPEVFFSDSSKVSIEAQARFIRAFCYFDLVRWFGKVPLIDRPIDVNESKSIGRSPVADVYELIIADFKFAEEHLPSIQLSTNVGRATTWAAKGLLAQVYMARSGPTYSIEGPGMGLNEWDKAYALLNEIANQGMSIKGEALGYVPNYADIFKTEYNKEVVFDVEYIAGTDGVGASFVWVLTSDEYFQSIGLSAQGSNYRRPVANSFRALFAASDKRLKASILDSFKYKDITYEYPMYIKYVDKSKYGSGRTNWGTNFIVLRYTDVMMLRAECTLHGGGGSPADVDDVVQAVRERAGDSATVIGINLDQLMAERRKEFCAEGTRWFDLQRSGKLVELMNAFRTADDLSGRILPASNNTVIYPVPQSQLNIVPGLYTQNPGYD